MAQTSLFFPIISQSLRSYFFLPKGQEWLFLVEVENILAEQMILHKWTSCTCYTLGHILYGDYTAPNKSVHFTV